MSAPNQTLQPKEERLLLFESLINELGYEEILLVGRMCSYRVRHLNSPAKNNMAEARNFIDWMCGRLKIAKDSAKINTRSKNYWLCIINNLQVSKNLTHNEIAKLLHRDASLSRTYKAEYEILNNIYTNEAEIFKMQRKEFLTALREYNNLKSN